MQLEDEKIMQYVQGAFGVGRPATEVKCFKEDLAYILHLVQKKESLYNELIK